MSGSSQEKAPVVKPKPKRRPKPVLENELQRIIPLHSEDSLEDDATDPGEEVKDASPLSAAAPHYMPENGIYIPLKGPDPVKPRKQTEEDVARKIEIQRKKKEIERLKKIEIERFKRAEQDKCRKKESEHSRNKTDHADKSRNVHSEYSNAKLNRSRADDNDLVKIIPLHGDTPPRRLSLGNNEDSSYVTQFTPWNDNNTSVKRTARDQDSITASATGAVKPSVLDLAINKPGKFDSYNIINC